MQGERALDGWGSRETRSFWLCTGADPETTFLLLRDHLAPCQMWCSFCPRSLEPERPEPVRDPALHAAIREEFTALVAESETRSLFLVSSDILEYPDLFALLDVAAAAGKRVILGTPGLALADEAFVARFVGRDVAFDLTWLSVHPEVYARITGRADAHARVGRAIELLRAHGLGCTLATVVVAENVGEVDLIVRFLGGVAGSERAQLRLFFPDIAAAPASYYDQFPSLAALREALVRLERDPPSVPIELGNTPLCQVDPEQTPGLDLRLIEHRGHQNTFKTEGVGVCGACEARERCVRFHPEQVARQGFGPIDRALVRRNLERLDRAAASALWGPTGVLPGEGVPKEQGVPKEVGVPKEQGVAPGQGVRPGLGVPRGQGVPKGTGKPKGSGVAKGEGMLPPGHPDA